tara:strand:- start:595 stop:990 length:396 start_codon:yes stop_codon:yes gene_type:complete
MIESEFYSTIKFKNGEEVFCKVAPSEEEDRIMLLISHPIMIEEVKSRGNITAYKFEPWLKTTREDMFVINIDEVLTMSESSDIEMITNYEDYINRVSKSSRTKLNRNMGHIGNVNDAKKSLEKMYNFKNST